MQLDFCAVCGDKNDLVQHHIVPVVYNTTTNRKNHKTPKEPKEFATESTITVCHTHHRVIHQQERKNRYSHKAMIRRGIQRARKLGVKLGRPTNLTEEIQREVIRLRLEGKSLHLLARTYRIGVCTVSKICKEHNQQVVDSWEQMI